MADSTQYPMGRRNASFETTMWTTVQEAGQQDGSLKAQLALERVCRTYWYLLYVFLRQQGKSPEDAEDLTQAFFAHLMEKEALKNVDRERGRFRSFLLSSLKHFVTDNWKKEHALKRGGQARLIELDAEVAEDRFKYEPVERLDPEKLFERRWAMTVLDEVLARLQNEYELKGKKDLFARIQPFLLDKKTDIPQAKIAEDLGMKESTLNTEVFRLRQRYREIFREEISHTVTPTGDVDSEMRELFAVIQDS
jgi:RNA polymerase sigma factor (sigma-70 family)